MATPLVSDELRAVIEPLLPPEPPKPKGGVLAEPLFHRSPQVFPGCTARGPTDHSGPSLVSIGLPGLSFCPTPVVADTLRRTFWTRTNHETLRGQATAPRVASDPIAPFLVHGERATSASVGSLITITLPELRCIRLSIAPACQSGPERLQSASEDFRHANVCSISSQYVPVLG